MMEPKDEPFNIYIKDDCVVCTNRFIGFLFERKDKKIIDRGKIILETDNENEIKIFLHGYLKFRQTFLFDDRKLKDLMSQE